MLRTIGTDNRRHLSQNLGEAVRRCKPRRCRQCILLRLLALGVADIVDVEAQCLGEVVKTLKLELLEAVG